MRKFWILRYVAICLACLLADKADDLLYHETSYAHNHPAAVMHANPAQIENENYSFSSPDIPCNLPRQTSLANASRTIAQAKRPNYHNTVRTGYILEKSGKSMNSYTTSLFFISIQNFPSGLTEANHRLISLGKLII